MGELGDKEFEVNGKKIGGESTLKFSFKTLIWILGLAYLALGYLYYDLRVEFKENNGISAEEKREFLKDVEDEYDSKFDKMFDDVSDIKGDIKVILDRQNRENPIIANPNATIQPIQPPD